ncbi:hemin uptake protein HemP [Jeongeupia naejangsanensis]|uniref:Hemin uptake protein HemP n=1 Tax=Jeongeupia naejangsanensis TaxID=613195 RepID=A0ABS2BIS6_9NEIS|nr:hemin uptake protein HemP [Jeongeupia naejangsanensis]MBM3115502.1 hemin uptake protein HemP [Jeongeupia naejangsanensis]
MNKQTPTTTLPAPALPVLNSNQLLQGQRAVVIDHNGERYTLRETRQGKLILTK